MRHGERVDDVFPNWIEKCNKLGKYIQLDMNMVNIKYFNSFTFSQYQ